MHPSNATVVYVTVFNIQGLPPGATWGRPPRARQKPYEIDPIRDAVSRYLVQTGATSQNRDGLHG